MGLNPWTSILIRDKREENIDTHGEVHVKMEAEIGVTQPQANESPESYIAHGLIVF